MAQSLTPGLPQTISKRYTVDINTGVWVAKGQKDFGYSDGDEAENYIYHSLKISGDVSCSSDELALRIKDWPSEYHLSPSRHNLLIPLQIKQGTKILELGCGMGAITRYLGEIGTDVTAVEGSIRRAGIARERCRDLNNVAIVCDNFKDFITNERFDIVTLIGVLEYSPKYIGGDNPISECLKIAKKYLKPEGSLLIAIENRLGLKYWNNCAEDHTGGIFDSIHDNYPVGTVVTFGYAEIKQILADSGFASIQFLFPFPDYKLARVILNEDSFNHKEINFASMIGQTYSRGYAGQPYQNFSERLAWHTLEKNELIPQFSNSFLVIANMAHHSSSFDVKEWIAKIYSSYRNACFRTETTIFKDMESSKMLVNKERLYKELPIKEGLLQFNDDIEKHYIEGILFSDEILKLFLQRGPYNAFVQKMTEYKDFIITLNKKKNPTSRTDYCSGELIDCTPFNLVRQQDKSLHYIDNEWRMRDDIPLVVVLLRGIFYELLEKINYVNDPKIFAQHANLRDLVVDIFKKIGLRLMHDDIDYFCQNEASILAQVVKSPHLKENLTHVHKSLFSKPLMDVLNIRTKLPIWEFCKLQEREYIARHRQLKGSIDLCASAYCDLGATYFEKGEQARALECYEKAVKIDPGNIAYQKKLAEFLHEKLTRTEEAIQIYLGIMKKHPEDIETLIALGNFCVTKRLFDNAKLFYEKALSLDPQNKIVRQKMADFTRQVQAAEKVVPYNFASIIILTYNSETTILNCIKSVEKYLRPEDEVIIVDNDSIDNTVKIVQKFIKNKKRFKLIQNKKNLGFSAGTNIGISSSNNPYIVMLNPDTIVTKNWTGRLIAHFTNKNIAAVGPVSNYVAGLQKMELYQKMAFPPGTQPDDIAQEFSKWNKGYTIDTKLLIGFCMMVHRDVFNKVGILDEDLFLGNDDLELCWRLRVNGFKLKVAADTFIYHMGQQSFNTESKGKTSKHVQESTDALYKKLQIYYGDDNVPTPQELWGIEWFTPSTPKFDEKLKLTDVVKNPINSNQKKIQLEKQIQNIVSIIILTFNQLKYTKECIESIRRYTPEPHQIIFVDNGSTDGTVKWLRQIIKENSNYRLIENRKNLGFARGCNQGITASSGEYILLLNNDVVVTEGWLSGMLECLTSNPSAGIVGPMTDNISGPQRVANANYSSMHRLHEYARSFREINRHRRIPFRRIVGFCMLFRRKLVGKIGLLDESFGSGNFEDDDFSLRASLEGYRNFIAGDVFIHHYGSRSFIGNSIDYRTTMSGNKRVFADKWSGIPSDSALGKRLIIRSAIENAEEMNQKGEVDKAVKKLIEGIGQSPESEEIYHVLAGVLIEAKRFKDALDALHSIPDSAKEDINTLELLAYCKEGMGLSEEAQNYAEQVLSMNPTRASALNLKGILAYKRGEEKTAENFFTKAIKSDPGYGRPHTNLGALRWAQGKKQKGMELLERGFILSPTFMDIANNYHAAIIETKELSMAEGLFKDAMAIYPLNQRISYLLIDILLQQGKYDAAMQEIEEAMVRYGIDDGILSAAAEVRKKIGPKEMDKANKDKGALSLSMIVKNEEQNIAKCLMSIKPIIDEMIVVDTGSTDRTKDIAGALGAKVYDFAWSDDFSGARNYSLSKASGDWIFVLDADEVISPLDHTPLLEITKKKNPSAYSLITRNYTIQTGSQGWSENDGKYPQEEAGIGWYPSSKVRLFKNDERIRFENRVHEFVEGTIKKTGLAIKSSSIPIHHYGRLDLEKVTAKGEAYYQLGKKKLKENGDNAKALYELAVQASELKKYEEAVDLWQKFIYLNPHEPLAHFNLGFAYMELEKYEEARIASKKAIEFSPNFKGAAINYAHCELYIGNVKKAISVLEAVLRNAPGFPSAMAALSAAYFIDKQKSKGFEIIEKLRKKSFDCAPFLHEISKGLFSSGRYKQALSLLEAAVESKNITDETRALVEKCCAVFTGCKQQIHSEQIQI